MSVFNNKDLLTRLCKEHTSIASIFRELNMRASGSSYTVFYRYCDKFNICPPKINPKECPLVAIEFNRHPDAEVFVQNSTYQGGGAQIKKRLIEMGREERCQECGLGALWEGKELKLQVDHINGVRTDNRLDNLRIICPNCHSQTDTFAGKRHRVIKKCSGCNRNVNRASESCNSCAQKKLNKHWIPWPSDKELKCLVWSFPITEVSKKLGVSDVAIHKRCALRGIEKPPQGYWNRIKVGGSIPSGAPKE